VEAVLLLWELDLFIDVAAYEAFKDLTKVRQWDESVVFRIGIGQWVDNGSLEKLGTSPSDKPRVMISEIHKRPIGWFHTSRRMPAEIRSWADNLEASLTRSSAWLDASSVCVRGLLEMQTKLMISSSAFSCADQSGGGALGAGQTWQISTSSHASFFSYLGQKFSQLFTESLIEPRTFTGFGLFSSPL